MATALRGDTLLGLEASLSSQTRARNVVDMGGVHE